MEPRVLFNISQLMKNNIDICQLGYKKREGNRV